MLGCLRKRNFGTTNSRTSEEKKIDREVKFVENVTFALTERNISAIMFFFTCFFGCWYRTFLWARARISSIILVVNVVACIVLVVVVVVTIWWRNITNLIDQSVSTWHIPWQMHASLHVLKVLASKLPFTVYAFPYIGNFVILMYRNQSTRSSEVRSLWPHLTRHTCKSKSTDMSRRFVHTPVLR